MMSRGTGKGEDTMRAKTTMSNTATAIPNRPATATDGTGKVATKRHVDHGETTEETNLLGGTGVEDHDLDHGHNQDLHRNPLHDMNGPGNITNPQNTVGIRGQPGHPKGIAHIQKIQNLHTAPRTLNVPFRRLNPCPTLWRKLWDRFLPLHSLRF